jgi:hypothetical protein
MIIAVDFDGTIVEHEFPRIGPEIEGAFFYLRKLQEDGHRIVLWTCRDGSYLVDAMELLQNEGIHPVAANSNDPNFGFEASRKIYYDILIDDRSLGGLPSWKEIYEKIRSI